MSAPWCQPWVTRTDATSCLAITINVRFRAAKGNLQPAHANRVAQQTFNVAGDKSLCQTVSLSAWLHSGHRKMWTETFSKEFQLSDSR